MQSWRDQHPDWDYQRFDDEKAREFLSSRHPSGVLSAYQRAAQPAQKAEVFRLAYLAAEGGFYAEPDDRSLASLESIVPAHARLVVFQEQYGAIASNFLGAVPGEPMIVKALDLAVQALNRGDHDVPWFSTGPGLLTRVFAQVHADGEASEGLAGGFACARPGAMVRGRRRALPGERQTRGPPALHGRQSKKRRDVTSGGPRA